VKEGGRRRVSAGDEARKREKRGRTGDPEADPLLSVGGKKYKNWKERESAVELSSRKDRSTRRRKERSGTNLLAFWAEITAVSSCRDPSSISLLTPIACCSTTLIVSSCCSMSMAIWEKEGKEEGRRGQLESFVREPRSIHLLGLSHRS